MLYFDYYTLVSYALVLHRFCHSLPQHYRLRLCILHNLRTLRDAHISYLLVCSSFSLPFDAYFQLRFHVNLILIPTEFSQEELGTSLI